jgi:GAF domain-containing protein
MTTHDTMEPDDLAQQVEERSDDLALAMSELAGVLLSDEGVDRTLQRVVDLAVRTIPGCTAAGVTLLAEGRPETAASTSGAVLDIDRRQYDAGNGPCLDALRHRRINRASAEVARRRWPRFAAGAEALGIRSFLAAPLITSGEPIGSLNLYSAQVEGFEALDDALIALFCGQASVALANAQVYSRAVALNTQLRTAMDSRATIEQAKGMLMERHGIGPAEAFAVLRERSQHTNRKLREVAEDVVARTE